MNATTLQDDLQRVSDALLHVHTAKGLIDHPAYTPLLAALTERKNGLKRRIEAQRAALAGTATLRPTFRVKDNPSSRMACVVFRPKRDESLPYLTEDGYATLKRLLCTTSDNIEVCAKYDVAVKSKFDETMAVIRAA